MSRNILEEIAAKTKLRIEEEKKKIPLEVLKEKIREKDASGCVPAKPTFYQALKSPGMSYICEVKKASPSKGLIAPDFPYLEIGREYEAAGAAAISCLTEPFYFLGSDRYLEEIAASVKIPVLRKDFTVDEYMIYQAKALGASAVLLICAILSDRQLLAYRTLAEELGMDALVEAHDEEEIRRALTAGAKIIGVNNRDLRTFQVDVRNSIRLRESAPREVIFVSESGIRTKEDIRKLYENQVDAVLIGETLMRSADKRAALEELNGAPLGMPLQRQAKIKICGLRSMEDIRAVNDAGPDFCGFIVEFPKSFRSISREEVRVLSAKLREGIIPVGVFVNAPLELPAELLKEGVIAMAQLHGQEDEDYIRKLRRETGKPVIKAFSIKTKEDIRCALACSADYILLDQGGGGTGKPFDWSLVPEIERPFFLAGGLNEANLQEAVRTLHPWAVDLSSSVETDRKKDPEKILAAVRAVRAMEE